MFGPRSAMLTLYGDYALRKGGEIGIGSLIKMLGNFGLSDQSIRSAVSRMCHAGLLKVRRARGKSYYSLTRDGFNLLDKGAQRIFERKKNSWNGSWSLVTYFIPEEKREARDTLRQELTWMGYGSLNAATWISPHDLTKEVEGIVKKLKIKEYVQVFQAKHEGFANSRRIVSRCWDLKRLHKKYVSFIDEYRPKLEHHLRRLRAGETIEPSECFVESFMLIDEYRRLPFFDPDLPEELLPANWLRSQASTLFHEYHALLAEKANRYFDSVLKAY